MTIRARNVRTWTDEQLAQAIVVSTSWRGVMRELGLGDTSAGSIRAVKRVAQWLGLDTSHFRGKRAWSDAQLRRAVMDSRSWAEALTSLGLAPASGDGKVRVKAHAIRLGLAYGHLETAADEVPAPQELKPDLTHLREAGAAIAASYFALCGCLVAFPVEPAVYDLLVSTRDGIKRVQVKTSTHDTKGGWHCSVGRRPYSPGNTERVIPYDPDVIDLFFIVDGDMTMYLVPSRAAAGRVRILLRAYTKYIVGNAAGLLGTGQRAA